MIITKISDHKYLLRFLWSCPDINFLYTHIYITITATKPPDPPLPKKKKFTTTTTLLTPATVTLNDSEFGNKLCRSLTLHNDVEEMAGLAVRILGLAGVLALVLLLHLGDLQDLPMILHDGPVWQSVADFEPLHSWGRAWDNHKRMTMQVWRGKESDSLF